MRKRNSGFTLVTLLVTLALVAVAAVVVAKLVSGVSKTAGSTEFGVKADEVLVRTTSRIYEQDFQKLLESCQEAGKNRMNAAGTPVNGPCLTADRQQLNDAMPREPGAADEKIEIARNYDGKPSAAADIPQVCIELNGCRAPAGGQVLEAAYAVFWRTGPPPASTFQGRTIVLRRSRW